MNTTEVKNKGVIYNRIIFILSVIGIIIAIYVTQSFLRQAPIVCISGGGCEAVRKHPASYLFGVVPVPAVGLIGYTVLAACAFLKTAASDTKKQSGIDRIMLGMSGFGVGFVTWFTYMELFVIKGICTWCAVSAVNMYILFSLVLLSQKHSRHLAKRQKEDHV